MNLNDAAQITLTFLQSGATVVIAGLIWKAMQQQVKAAKAAENSKTQTLADLKTSHAGEIASLQALVTTLKEQRDFGSKAAREIRKDDVDTLERELEKWKREAQQLTAKLEDLQTQNKTQTVDNQRLILELEKLRLGTDAANYFVLDDLMSGLKRNNLILKDTNYLLKGLKPSVVGSETQLINLHTAKIPGKFGLLPTQVNSPVILDIDPAFFKTI